MISPLIGIVAAQIDQLTPPGARILIAVSGGPDSLALLDILHRGIELHQRPLLVAHIDHGIAAESAEVARRVEEEAARRDLPYLAERLGLAPGTSETRARQGRKAALRRLLTVSDASFLALGHHADDQAETVLMRVLKGSGPAGLAGMAPRRGPWIRPLLDIDRASLLEYGELAGLSPWQDPANRDSRHLRSWLRTVALPLLRGRVPDVERHLRRVARNAARQRSGLNMLPESLSELAFRRESEGFSVARPALIGYPSGLQSVVIGALGRRLGVALGDRHRAALLEFAASGGRGAELRLTRVLTVESSLDRLHFRRPLHGRLPPRGLPRSAGWVEWEAHRLTTSQGHAGLLDARVGQSTWLGTGEYLVRSPQPGDRIFPLGGTGRRAVTVLLREARIPAAQRKRWPLIVDAADPATVVWVAGICRSSVNVPEQGEDALHVRHDLA